MLYSEYLNRLVTAALVSEAFRDLLLVNPRAALERGYNGEQFDIPPEIMEKIASIQAENLADFANKLVIQFDDR